MDKGAFEELLTEALAEVAPNWNLGEDTRGQIVIFTGLSEDEDDGELIEFEKDEDEDHDADEDLESLEDEEELE